MSILKVEGERFEIQRDPKGYNAFVWSGLTLGKLMALRQGLIEGPSSLGHELFVCLDNAIAQAEADAKLIEAQAKEG